MKRWKSAAVCLLAGALLSCDVLLDPIQGRWNPADPKNTLVRVDKSIYPVVDGYIDDSNFKDFGGPLLRVGNNAPMQKILLRFDPADFPPSVDSAALQLCFSSATNADSVTVFRIIQDWSPADLSWYKVVYHPEGPSG